MIGSRRPDRRRGIDHRRFGLAYVGIALFALFAVWLPDTFLTGQTLKSVLNQEAVTAIVALGLVVPLCAGCYDLSVGWALGLASMLVSVLLIDVGLPVPLAVIAALACGALVGAVNGAVVVGLGVHSFIATLGMGSILAALIAIVSGGEQVIGLPEGFKELALADIGGVDLAVLYLVVLAAALWWVLEQTPTGRRIHATGGALEAARLTGVDTDRMRFLVFVASGLIAAVAGVLLAARLGSAAPETGPSYLLPAFAAAFLGATQRGGRFNVLGTLVAVYVLAIGVKGLQLAGAPFWLPDLFNGVALILAVALSSYQRAPGRRWLRVGRRRGGTPQTGG